MPRIGPMLRAMGVVATVAGIASAGELATPTRPANGGEPVKLVGLFGDPAFRHGSSVVHMQVLSDGQRVLTCGQDALVCLWDLKTGKKLQSYRHGKEYVWDFALLPGEDKLLTTGDDENSVWLWDLKTGQRLRSFPHTDMVFRLDVDPTGKRFAAGDKAGHCIVWDLAEGKPLADLPRHSDAVYTVLFDRDGSSVLTGSNDSSIRRCDIASAEAKTLKGKDKKVKDGQRDPPESTGSIYTLAPAPDRSRIVVCCAKRGPWLMDAQTGKELWRVDAPSTYCAAWSPDGKTVAVVPDKQLWLLNAADGAKRWAVDLAEGTHYGVAFSPDGKEILCGSQNLLCRFDSADGKRRYPAPEAPLQQKCARAVAAVPGVKLLLEGGSAEGVRVWDRRTRTVKQVWLPHEDVGRLAVSADGSTVLAAGEKSCLLIDASSGKTLRSWPAEGYGGNSAALSPDGKLAVLPEGYRKITVARTSDGVSKLDLDLGDSGQFSFQSGARLSIGPDFELAAPCSDGSVGIWSLLDGKFLHRLSIARDQEKKPAAPGRPAGPPGPGGAEPASISLEGCAFFLADPPAVAAWDSNHIYLWMAQGRTPSPLTEKEVRELIALLGCNSYKQRESATNRLIAAGRSILPVIRAARSDDTETAARLAGIQVAVSRGRAYGLAGTLDLGKRRVECFAVGPNGRYWVAVVQGEILIGEIRDGRLCPLWQFGAPDGPRTLAFDPDGVLLVGNGNGTVSEYVLDTEALSALPALAVGVAATQPAATTRLSGPPTTQPQSTPTTSSRSSSN